MRYWGVCLWGRSECWRTRGGGGGWHKASVSDCLPLAAPIGLSPLLSLTLCGSERVLVVSTEPPDDLSCLTTPGVGRPGDGLLPRAVDRVHAGGGGGDGVAGLRARDRTPVPALSRAATAAPGAHPALPGVASRRPPRPESAGIAARSPGGVASPVRSRGAAAYLIVHRKGRALEQGSSQQQQQNWRRASHGSTPPPPPLLAT